MFIKLKSNKGIYQLREKEKNKTRMVDKLKANKGIYPLREKEKYKNKNVC